MHMERDDPSSNVNVGKCYINARKFAKQDMQRCMLVIAYKVVTYCAEQIRQSPPSSRALTGRRKSILGSQAVGFLPHLPISRLRKAPGSCVKALQMPLLVGGRFVLQQPANARSASPKLTLMFAGQR